MRGITGQKGHVHVAFGKALQDDFEDAEQVATAIDKQIYQNYYLHPSNYIAAKQQSETISEADKQAFESRLQSIKPELQETVLKMYANTVNNRIV